MITSFKDAESSPLAAIERDLFRPFSDREVILGFKKPSPIFFVTVKPCGDGDDIAGSLRLKTPFRFF